MWLSEITLQLLAFRVLALLIIAPVQGGALAGTAFLLGDKGPKYDGRLTAMPTRHVNPLGAAGLILFGLGWAKPVEIDAGAFRIGRIGVLVVVLAGFVALLATAAALDALILPALTTLSQSAGLTASAFLRGASSLSIWVALLGLVPVPPLPGGLILQAAGLRIPRRAQFVLAALLLVAVASGVVRPLLAPAHAALASVILGD